MAPPKTNKSIATKAKKITPLPPMEPNDCCGADSSCSTDMCCESRSTCTSFWKKAVAAWWAVTWRTFLWVSVPMMAIQVAMTWLQHPDMGVGMLSVAMMIAYSIPGMVKHAVLTSQFWFFIAVTAYSLVGGIYVYGHVVKMGKFTSGLGCPCGGGNCDDPTPCAAPDCCKK